MIKTAKQLGVTLKGDRNQCPVCGRLFNSSYAFTKHKTGEIGVNRRCMTEVEMLDRGMALGADGFWVGSVMNADVVAAIVDADQEVQA